MRIKVFPSGADKVIGRETSNFEAYMTEEYEITAGTLVALRSGTKAWVIGKDRDGRWAVQLWGKSDCWFYRSAFHHNDVNCDIVGPWVEPPKTERKTIRGYALIRPDGSWHILTKEEELVTKWRQGEEEIVELTGTTSKEYPA